MGLADSVQCGVIVGLIFMVFSLAWAALKLVDAFADAKDAARRGLDDIQHKLDVWSSRLDKLGKDLDALATADYSRRYDAAKALCPEAFEDDDEPS